MLSGFLSANFIHVFLIFTFTATRFPLSGTFFSKAFRRTQFGKCSRKAIKETKSLCLHAFFYVKQCLAYNTNIVQSNIQSPYFSWHFEATWQAALGRIKRKALSENHGHRKVFLCGPWHLVCWLLEQYGCLSSWIATRPGGKETGVSRLLCWRCSPDSLRHTIVPGFDTESISLL